MTMKVYQKLQEQLDQYSVGFPATDSGVELKILEKLFTEEEAEMFLLLSMMLETPESVAQRIERDPSAVAALLHQMAEKGPDARSPSKVAGSRPNNGVKPRMVAPLAGLATKKPRMTTRLTSPPR